MLKTIDINYNIIYVYLDNFCGKIEFIYSSFYLLTDDTQKAWESGEIQKKSWRSAGEWATNIINSLTPRSDQHEASPYNLLASSIQQTANENIQTYQVEIDVLI